MGYWLEHGMTFADMAGIPEKDMPKRVGDVIEKLRALCFCITKTSQPMGSKPAGD